MVGSVPQSQPQPQPQPQPPSAEEEALRRNTDCVYFLASPLTCKKGSECEYRHSDFARVNPRDCRFWLHGNCLNPKCGFRHPPLDGLLGTQTPTSVGSSAHVPPNVAAPTPNASTKQGVPCIFFQKGFCVKGDWCPFIHLPNSVSSKASLVTGMSSTAESVTTIKRAVEWHYNSVQKNALPMNAAKSDKDSLQAKSATEVQPVCPRDDFVMNRKALQMPSMANFPVFKTVPAVSNGNSASWSGRVQQPHLLDEPENMYSKDAGEVSREPSPGFDVLVDDEGRDSDYFPVEDRYGMSMEHEARKEYDMDCSDYDTITAFDDERYEDSLGYDSHKRIKGGQHAWEQQRASSERISGGFYDERKPHVRPNSLDQVDEFDLRHRLTKPAKPNGLRSVINHERGDRNRQSHGREGQHVQLHESSFSSRLRGRIRHPGRSSSPSERDIIRANGLGRLSPPLRSGISTSHPGRIWDRIKGGAGVEEAYNNSAKNHRGLQLRRDNEGDNNADFAGPKSLAELKYRKNDEPTWQHTTDQQSLGKRKQLTIDANQQSGSDLSFEGPKPLEEILNRKRGKTMRTTNPISSSEHQVVTADENQEGNNKNKNELNKCIPGQSIITEASSLATSNSPTHPIHDNQEAVDVMPAVDQVDQETEVHDPKDGEYDYDQDGGEDYYLYNGENGDGAEEYIEDEEEDDDDDFAKKMGVVYS